MALNLLGRRRTPLTAIYPKNRKKYILKQNNQGLVMLQSELNWLLKYQVKWLDDNGPHVMPSPIFDWILNDVAFARYDFLWGHGRFRAELRRLD